MDALPKRVGIDYETASEITQENHALNEEKATNALKAHPSTRS